MQHHHHGSTYVKNHQALTVTLNPAIDQTLTINDFAMGSVNRVEHEYKKVGGKGINVASALASYGVGVAATGFLGRNNAKTFEAHFNEKNISDQFIRIAGETRIGIKIADPMRCATTDINLPGLTPLQEEFDALYKRVDDLTLSEGTWIALSGSVPPSVDPSVYCGLIKWARGCGHKVILDTSGEPLRLALNVGPDIVKPNIHELEDMLGERLETREAIVNAARMIVARGVNLVVVSLSGDGALFVSADEVIAARPPKIEVHSTVGAGDAMVAGLIAGHLRNLPLADCARLATAFAVDVLSQDGAGLRSKSTLECTMKKVALLW